MVRAMAVTKLGVVYTPRDVSGPMVELALAPLLAGKTRDEILALRVCDPALGEGAFLLEVIRVLAAAAKCEPRAVARCVHGVDLDPRAVTAARAAIESHVGARVPELGAQLRTGDALVMTGWPAFDAVVGNPPYIRQERLGATKHALHDYASYDGVADLYVYFIELAHRLVRRGGRYCLIVPDKWLTAAYGRPLRTWLAREASLEQIVDFGRGLFPDADAFPCIIAGTVGISSPSRRTTPIRASRVVDTPVAAALAAPGIPHPRASWSDDPWHIESHADGALVDRLAKRWPSLGDVIPAPSRGIVTGCNRAFVIDAATRARLGDSPLVRPFIKGRDVRRWRPAPIDRHVLLIDRGTEPPPALLAHLEQFRDALEPGSGRKTGTYKWFELQDPVVPLAKSRAPRLFYQDIQTAPACCLDPTGELVPDTTVWILPTDDRFVLAVLNSKLYGWYARHRFPPALNGAVRPKLEYMRRFPLAAPTADLRARITALVDAQLATQDAARDAELDRLICDAYELSRRERERVTSRAASGS